MKRAAAVILILCLSLHAAVAAGAGKPLRKMKVRITSPAPGQSIAGTVPVEWEITDTGRPQDAPPSAFYSISFYVDTHFIGASRNADPPFELDTSQLENGRHLLTINVLDDENRVAASSIWIKVVNEE